MFKPISTLRGIMAMEKSCVKPRPAWGIDKIPHGFRHFCFWVDMWTPSWHEGRGPYVSIGLGWIVISRGY